jgi:hypothetical protein
MMTDEDLPRIDPNELVTVYTHNDSNIVEVLRAALEGEGIKCHIEGEHQGGFAGVFDMSIQVRAADADHARRYIEQHHA